jgi:hypothetical protein
MLVRNVGLYANYTALQPRSRSREKLKCIVFSINKGCFVGIVLRAVTMKCSVIWNVTSRTLVYVPRRFLATYCLHLQG